MVPLQVKATKLLLVEDSVIDGKPLGARLFEAGDNLGFELVRVFRLADALQQLHASVFDLVLLDLSLPDGGHGVATAAALRSAHTAVPIIILTAFDYQAVAADQQRRVAAIERSADELVQLIESTLTMARLIAEVCVSSLLTELKAEFLEAFQKKGLQFAVQIPPPGFTMQTDRIKLKGVLRNLLENARKFTAEGKVELTFMRHHGDRRVEFAVSDTGIGIKKEVLPKIFELFYQADPTLGIEPASAGMGLNIVKRLVGAMSGQISVTSEPGKGSTFRVDFPRDGTAPAIDVH